MAARRVRSLVKLALQAEIVPFVDIITHHSVPKGSWGPFDITHHAHAYRLNRSCQVLWHFWTTGPTDSLPFTLIILMTKGSLVRIYVQIASESTSALPRTRYIVHQCTTRQTPAHEAPRTGSGVTLLSVTFRRNTPTGKVKFFRITRAEIPCWSSSRHKIDRIRRPFKERHIPRSRIQWRGSHTCRSAA